MYGLSMLLDHSYIYYCTLYVVFVAFDVAVDAVIIGTGVDSCDGDGAGFIHHNSLQWNALPTVACGFVIKLCVLYVCIKRVHTIFVEMVEKYCARAILQE